MHQTGTYGPLGLAARRADICGLATAPHVNATTAARDIREALFLGLSDLGQASVDLLNALFEGRQLSVEVVRRKSGQLEGATQLLRAALGPKAIAPGDAQWSKGRLHLLIGTDVLTGRIDAKQRPRLQRLAASLAFDLALVRAPPPASRRLHHRDLDDLWGYLGSADENWHRSAG